MSNNWGEDRTGFDKELYDLGKVLQNIGSLHTLIATIEELNKIVSKIQERNRKAYIEELDKNR